MAEKKIETRAVRWAAAVRDSYDLNESEDLLVDEIAATIEVIDSLPDASVVEARQQRTILARMTAQLNLPEAGGAQKKNLTASQRGSRGARARWDKAKGVN